MGVLRYKRFTNVEVLKRIDFDLLKRFLTLHRDYLESNGLTLTDAAEDFDYAKLSGIFIKPSVEAPEDFLDALYFVDDLSSGECQERLEHELEEAGIEFDGNNISAEDLVLLAWLEDSDIVERVHAEKFLTKPKTFLSFDVREGLSRDFEYPTELQLKALEIELDRWFESKKRGRGTRVFPFSREDGFWFLVRHGQRIKREGTVESGGDSGSVYYRPEKFDVLIYYPDKGEITIYADTKGERKIYCKLFGRHLFDSDTFFRFDDSEPKYTLNPLIEDGPASLTCVDVEGISRIRLYELHISHDSDQKNIEVRKADNVFKALAEESRDLHDETDGIELITAKFKVEFSDHKERSVIITPPNKASFDRESDSLLVARWLELRSFIVNSGMEAQEDVLDAVLAEA